MNENKNKKMFSSRRFRYGSVATALSVGFLVVIVLINVIASVVMNKYPLKIDLTKDNVFGITKETKEYISALDQDVVINVLSTEEEFTSLGQYFEQANEILKDYAKHSDHVTVKYIDLVKDPTFASNYPSLTLAMSDVLVTSGDRVQQVPKADLFDIQTAEYGQNYIAASVAEQSITSAILNVTSKDRPKVVFTTGHGEMEAPDFRKLIEKNNYEVVERNLSTEGIDEDALFVVVVAPSVDFDENTLAKVESFLSNGEKLGKNMMYFANSSQTPLTNVEAFLEENGIEVGHGSVLETNNSRIFANDPSNAIVDYVSNDFYKKLHNTSIYPIFSYARPLTVLWANSGYMEAESLLNYSNTAVIRPADADDKWNASDYVAPDARQIPALAKSSRLRYEGSTVIRSNIIVSGSTSCIDNFALGTGAFSNAEYFLNVFNVLSGRDEGVSIVSKSLGGNMLNITTEQTIGISVVFAIILPLVVMILGISLWLMRRHK